MPTMIIFIYDKTDVSHHFGTFTIIYNKHRINKNDIIRTRSINEENINKFKSNLEQMDITLILSQTDANKAYELFLEQYQQRFDTHFPLKEIIIKKQYIKRDPWMTKALLNSSIH